MTRWTGALGLAGCLIGGAAAAQGVPPYEPSAPPAYDRAGVPEVLKPQPTVRDGAPKGVVLDRFRAAYGRNRSPRLAIFWNRTLTDQVEAQRVEIDSETKGAVVGGAVDTHGGTSSSSSRQPYGYGRLDQGSTVGERHTTFGAAGVSSRDRIRTQAQVGSGARAPALAERDAWRFEQGFTDAFQGAGARLVDRNTIVRLAGSGNTASPDVQRIELAALKGHADLFVEVLATPDAESPSGYVFRATAKDVGTGRILADVTSDGAEADTASEWVATSRGFEERRSRKAATLNGSELALALMDRLASAWAR